MGLISRIILDELILDDIIQDFSIPWDEDVITLLESFVCSHNSSLIEKSGTTYWIFDWNNLIWCFVLNLWEFRKNTKNREFCERNKLTHEYYPIINLEFIIRRPWKDFEWIWEVMFDKIKRVIWEINSKIDVKPPIFRTAKLSRFFVIFL